MNRAAQRRAGRPALDLIEAAVHLLRTAPAGALLAYYAGSIPCLLGLLCFWADMSRGAFARESLLEAALGATLLYLWMKCWQAVFAAKLRAHLLGEADAGWTLARVARLALVQIALQPLGLFARPVAAQILIPYVWTYAFFQNVGVLGDGTRAGLGDITREAAWQAGLWPRQIHAALGCIFGFMLFVWANICVLFGFAPVLLKTFFGVETVFSRDPMTMLNTTTFAATLAATYLCIDPIRKALIVLRCFHGASMQSGEDLRTELRVLRAPARAAVIALTVLGLLCGGPLTPARAAEPPPATVAPATLDGALDRALQRREYAWRLPRDAVAADASKGWFISFFEGLWKGLVRTAKQVVRWFTKAYEWLRQIFDRAPAARETSKRAQIDWSGTARWTLIALAGALVLVFAALLWRWRRGRRAEIALAQPVAAIPDLNEEGVTADQLPEDGWHRLARELLDRGERRLALRAFYLAGLAHLGQRDLIQLARHKSNRDYDRELRRRARANADLLTAFDANLLAFEASWYGEHPVTPDTLGGFTQNLERIRAC